MAGPPSSPSPGLTSGEAERLLLRHGPNVLVPERRRPPRALWFLRAFADPMVLLLLVAGPTYLALGDTRDAAVTLAAVLPIAGVGLALEARAERALDRLRTMTAPTARAWRDGRLVMVPARSLVPGDVIEVREGDVVPADAELRELTQLALDEAALTGESQPVRKEVAGPPDARMILAGTTVVSGRGTACVTATGLDARYGRIGALMAGIRPTPTPLERLVRRFVRSLGVVAVAACVAVTALEVVRGQGFGSAVIAGVSLAIAAVPEEFPMVYTLFLAVGAWRLAQRHALVRRLPAVETLGSATVICTDKTGTLTEGRLEVAALAGAGGQILEPASPEGRALLEGAARACEPQPFDPLDRAVLRSAADAGADVGALSRSELLVDFPFDPVTRYLTHVWRAPDGALTAAAKGAVEGVLDAVGASSQERAVALAANEALAARGLRVLAVAVGQLANEPADRAEAEAGLRLAGLVTFVDPVRAGVAAAVADCRAAGVRVVMVTGDHPVTARAVAEEVGLREAGSWAAGEIVTGEDLDRADDDALGRMAAEAVVFARTRPEQKHRLVLALRAAGEVVAMTGDGVNDAPALREADIGVAMGERGTAVAREAAAMVLLDDDFATIVSAVRRGRRIVEDLRRAFGYLVAFHVPLLAGALVIPLLGRPLLLLPVHLVFLELVLHPTVSLVFQSDPDPPDLMARRPRPADQAMAARDVLGPALLGSSLAVAVVGAYLMRLGQGAPVGRARAFGLAVLVLGQALLVLTSRAPDRPFWQARRVGPVLPWVIGGTVAALVAAVAWPPAANVLRLQGLSLAEWATALALAAVATLWSEPAKRGRPAPSRPRWRSHVGHGWAVRP